MRAHGRRWLGAATVLIALAGLVAWRATNGDEESHQYSGDAVLLDGLVPARAGVTLPPGTPIGAGLKVAEGSHLLGGALPYLHSTMHGGDPIEDDGFRAWLLVTEPIRDVVDRYRAQAKAAGFVMTPVDCAGDEGVLQCSTTCAVECGFPYDAEHSFEHGRNLLIIGQQGDAGHDPPISDLLIDYRAIGEPPYPGGDYNRPEEPSSIPRGSVPKAWPQLPDVGEHIYSFNDFEVAPGTVLLAHGLNASAGSGEADAVFEVIGDVDDVINEFASQPRYPADNLTRDTFTRNGHRYERADWTDGRAQTIEIYDPPTGPTILVLSSYSAD